MRLRFLGTATGLLLSAVAAYGQAPSTVSDTNVVWAASGSDSTVVRAAPSDTTAIADSARPIAPLPATIDSQAQAVLADTASRNDSSKAVLRTDSAPNPVAAMDTVHMPIDTAWKDSAALLRHMGVVVVHGQLRGKIKAQSERKDAANRKDVLSIEAIEEQGDPDVADALQRAPGVTLQRSQGEGNYVQIRGTEPRLSTVTLNGQQLSSSSGDTRAVDLSVIPVDQLSEVEITKVLMPEMDGDAIGGTVNLVTPTARDTHLVVKALLASGWNDLSGEPLWQGSVALSRRFLKDGALGVYLGGSWFKDQTRTDDIELTWDTAGSKNTIWDMDMRQYLNQKERTGASGRLDWRFPDGSVVYLTGNWNQEDDQQLRNRFTIDRNGASQAQALGTQVIYPDSFVYNDDLKYKIEVRQQEKVKDVSQATLGGNTRIGPVLLDLSGTGSSSTSDQDPNLKVEFDAPKNLNSYIDPSNPDIPTFDAFLWRSPVGIDPRYLDPSKYTLSEIQSVGKRAEEDDLHGRFDSKFSPGDDSAWIVSAGAKTGWNHKDQYVYGSEFQSPSGTAAPTLDEFLASGSNSFYNGNYNLAPLPDINAVRTWFNNHRAGLDTTGTSDMHIQDDPDCYTVTQFHWAGYGQVRWTEGDFSATGGMRAERYDVRSTGNDVHEQADESWSYTVPVTVDRTFDFLLPMVSARWTPLPSLVARASYTRSFVLPDAMDLLPTTQVDLLDLTENVGNPNLKATQADAIETDLEWYHQPHAFASIGIFGKRLTDYIFPDVWVQWDNIRKATFTYYSKLNGHQALLGGVELELQQPFKFLPWYFSSFGVDANWTFTGSSTTLPGRTQSSTLPGQSDQSGNLGLRFDLKGFSAVAALNLQSPFLFEMGTAPEYDNWVDWHQRLDVSLSQRLWHGVLIYTHLANLTNSPYRIYMGDTQHPIQIEYYGRSYEAGVRISL
ncbi:MAG TPA: TonB-dependent receptor [Fibrobacteria bacterium]|nr:TonB-dependent receptor [Fibrobacteria bacterium]